MTRSHMQRHDPASSGGEVVLPAVWGIVHRHRWLLGICTLVGLGAGLGLATLQTPRYEASTSILVGAESQPLSAVEMQIPVGEDVVGTKMEVLKSRRLARAVIDSLRLQVRIADPVNLPRAQVLSDIRVAPDAAPASYRFSRTQGGGFLITEEGTDRRVGTAAPGQRVELPSVAMTLSPGAAARDEFTVEVRSAAATLSELAGELEIRQPSDKVNIIQVAYRGTDPNLVRDVPNVLTARFVELQESVRKTEARNAVHFLREQLDTLATQLTMSEERLKDFRESERVVDPQLEASTRITRLAQLQADRGALESERAALAALLADVRAQAARTGPNESSPYRTLVSFPSLLRNPAASELLSSLAAMENQRAQLIVRRKPTDPEVQVLTARIRELENQLGAVATTYLQGLTNQVRAMDQNVGQFRAELDRAPAQEVQYERLSRQPEVLQQMYALLQTRLKEAEISQAIQDPGVQVVDAADLPAEPKVFNPFVIGFGSAVFGLLFGIVLAFAREYTDRAVRTRAEVQAAMGVPVLGLIPNGTSADRGRALPGATRLLPATDRAETRWSLRRSHDAAPVPTLLIHAADAPTPLSDAYHRLHANILFARPETEVKTLLFTSPLPGDGKTTTASHLAITLAQSGLKVLLIDADLRRGTVHQLFGADRVPGLSDLLGDQPVLDGVLRTADVGRGKSLRYIAAGATPANPVQVLGSEEMRSLVECAAQEYDKVIIDSPPLHLFPDASVLSGLADAVLVVARAGETPFEALVDAAEQLRRANTRLVGGVLNGIDFQRDAPYDGSYRWYAQAEAYRAPADATTVGAA